MTQSPANPTGTSILRRGMQPTHELMAEWILQNPGGTLREMGAFFGYSESWLSQVINSDMFKSHMGDRLKDIRAYVSMDIPEKMKELANQSIERMREVLEKTEDSNTIVDSFDKIMHRYGYAPNARNALQPGGPAANVQNNVFFLSREEHSRVRERLINSHAETPALPAPAATESLPQPSEEDVKERSATDT